MQKLDRLGWAAGETYSAFGLRVGVRVNREDFPQELRQRLPQAWKKSSSKRHVDYLYSLLLQEDNGNPRVRKFHLAYSDAAIAGRSLDYAQILELLASDMHRFAAEFSRTKIFVHAGVVAWKNRAILVPGKSFSGKSTLVAELVRAGAGYCSDEYAVLDAKGRVHPYPLRLSLRDSGKPQKSVDISDLGGRAATKPMPVGGVIFASYQHGECWNPRQLTAGETVLKLFEHTVQARTRPREALNALQKVAAQSVALESVRGEASGTAAAILQKFSL